jgi:hypothetical protein
MLLGVYGLMQCLWVVLYGREKCVHDEYCGWSVALS